MIWNDSFLCYIHCIAMFTGYPARPYTMYTLYQYLKLVSMFHVSQNLAKFFNLLSISLLQIVTFGHPEIHRPSYLIVISADNLAPNRKQIRIWWCILTWINPNSHWTKRVGEDLASAVHCIFFIIIRFFFSEIARLWHIFVLYIIHQNTK